MERPRLIYKNHNKENKSSNNYSYKIAITILILLIIFSSLFVLYQNSQIIELQSEKQDLQSETQELKSIINHMEGNLEPIAIGQNANCSRPSLQRNVKTKIVFQNLSNEILNVSWINFNGQNVIVQELEPEAIYIQDTFLDHTWCIRNNDSGEIILSVVGTTHPLVITLP